MKGHSWDNFNWDFRLQPRKEGPMHPYYLIDLKLSLIVLSSQGPPFVEMMLVIIVETSGKCKCEIGVLEKEVIEE